MKSVSELKGRELDSAVAEEVFGLEVVSRELYGRRWFFYETENGPRESVPTYSYDGYEKVITRMRVRFGSEVHISCSRLGVWSSDFSDPEWSGWWRGMTASESVCRAALEAVRRAKQRDTDYENGKIGRREGKSLSNNPYPKETAGHDNWEHGWRVEHHELLRREMAA